MGVAVLRISASLIALIVPAAAGAFASPAAVRPSLQNSFALGGGGETVCRVQSAVQDPAIKSMFDRVYSIVCRDAAQPIGHVYALRKGADDPAARLEALRKDRVSCAGDAAPAAGLELKSATLRNCSLTGSGVGYKVYSKDGGRTLYVAEGLGGYDSALTLALRSIVADRVLPGQISIAETEMGDPAAFARIQAGSLDADQALDEGYRRNNSGNYAEAAEFFDTLLQRGSGGDRGKLGEYLINRALQRSNLGAFAEAERLFQQADAIPTNDPVQLRLRRNYGALHLLNQRKFKEARTLLAKPIAAGAADAAPADKAATISVAAADLINNAMPLAQQLSGERSARLSPDERARILDAQAELLQGTILRRENRAAEAAQKLNSALQAASAIRDGRVTSTARLRAQGLNELSLIAEAQGNFAEADRLLRQAVAVLDTEYPGSVAVAAAKGRLAAYLVRRGQTDAAIDLYRDIVGQAGKSLLASDIPSEILAPYFDVLARTIPSRPELVSDFFLAGETLMRPGVAQTQAVLARELSAGDDEAARLFRQSVTLTREVEQKRVAIARLSADDKLPPEGKTQLADLQRALKSDEEDQASVQAKLAEFPRYRAISTKALTLDDLKASLKPGEAYLKMSELGGAVYAMLVTRESATAYRAGMSPKQLESEVDALRDTISKTENGQQVTYPFDLERAHRLYSGLFGPVSDRLLAARHIIFEPAGAMLRLPPNLLVVDDSSVARYRARTAAADADAFDYRGTAWLGRDHDISTAVSARAFRDIRAARPSSAKLEYLGLGNNAPVGPMMQLTGGTRGGAAGDDCGWGLNVWNNPISAAELVAARSVVGANKAQLLTGALFTDTAVMGRKDLSNYRVLHFATHGLVAPPRPQCPSEPALLTSFDEDSKTGTLKSDGLLSFREIFDLKLDADLVILSACDTAAAASKQATRETGLSAGGGFALDGLVRAFVGAGGRSVVASHWPAPDDYGATEKLIGSLFTAPKGTAITDALRQGQVKLMDEAATSHPYYWAGFAVIGDGTKPVLSER